MKEEIIEIGINHLKESLRNVQHETKNMDALN